MEQIEQDGDEILVPAVEQVLHLEHHEPALPQAILDGVEERSRAATEGVVLQPCPELVILQRRDQVGQGPPARVFAQQCQRSPQRRALPRRDAHALQAQDFLQPAERPLALQLVVHLGERRKRGYRPIAADIVKVAPAGLRQDIR